MSTTARFPDCGDDPTLRSCGGEVCSSGHDQRLCCLVARQAEVKSQILTVWSSLPENAVRPSGEIATAFTDLDPMERADRLTGTNVPCSVRSTQSLQYPDAGTLVDNLACCDHGPRQQEPCSASDDGLSKSIRSHSDQEAEDEPKSRATHFSSPLGSQAHPNIQECGFWIGSPLFSASRPLTLRIRLQRYHHVRTR